MKIEFVWETLERTLADLEYGHGDLETLIQTAQAGILLLLDYPAEEILNQIECSPLPTKPTVSWLLFEALKIKMIDPARLKALRVCWDQRYSSELGRIHIPAQAWDRPHR